MEIEKLDIDSIFTKYTINEIRDIEDKIKIDMEKKKEELRSMVGERYRDLIEAADAIFEMKNCAKGVEQFVHLLNEKCSKIDHKIPSQVSSASAGKMDKQSNKVILAVSVKILAETRRQCWAFIEENNYKAAARQYLFAQHMAASFLSSTVDEPLDSDAQKAVTAATRIWHQTRSMKTIILDKCRLYLKCSDANVQILANALSTLIAFGNKTIEQALNELLEAKLDSIKECYQNTDIKQTSKDTVRQLLMIFINSIFELDSLFSKNTNDNDQYDQLKANLQTFFNPSDQSESSTAKSLLSFTQQQVLNAENIFFKNCETIDLSDYQSQQEQLFRTTVEKWLQTALAVVRSGLQELLSHVTSLKSLLNLKCSLVSLLNEKRMQDWPIVFARLFNAPEKEVRLWNDFIKVELRARAKLVLQVRFDQFQHTAIENVERKLDEYQKFAEKNDLTSHEYNVLDYIWSTIDNHVPSDYVWTPSTSRIPIGDAKFSLKAVAVSVDLQSLCQDFDKELRQILDDVQEFSMADGSSTNETLVTSNSSMLNYSDSGFVEEHLEECILQFCTTFIDRLRKIAYENEKTGDEQRTCNSLIWLGCCARSIPIVCKNLKNSLELVASVNESINSSALDRKIRGISQIKRVTEKSDKTSWLKTRQMFTNAHIDLFKQWITHVCAHTDMQLHARLRTFLDDIPSVMWEEVEIEEMLDTDEQRKTVIRVPMYPTPFIEELLFDAGEKINRALAHGTDKDLTNELAHRLLQTFSNVYDSWWSIEREKFGSLKRSQTRIIQLVYDLRFVHMLLERKDNTSTIKETNDRFIKLIETIESEVDPFDLNVLSPYMQSNLQKVIPRSSLLFGHLITNDRLIPSKPLPMNSQDTNNILSLSTCPQRFSLLPIANAGYAKNT